MNELILQALNERIALLKRALKQAEKMEKTFPEGRLRVNRTSRQTRYYKMTDKTDKADKADKTDKANKTDKTGEYLSKKYKLSTIKQLAQKDYNKQFLKTAEKELKMLEALSARFNKHRAEEVYNNLLPERKSLVTPYIQPDDLIAIEWQSKPFKPNPYKPEKKIFATRRGEMVRSKSEAIIADILYEMGIPYRYECPVKMCNGETKYPDFTLLNLKTRKIIYFEHFGRMDDEDYRKKTREKMDLYRASGIYPGKNLMFTYETEDNPLDISGVRKMLTEVFLS